MAATIRAKVTGIKELNTKLKKLTPATNRQIMVQSLLDCAALVQENAATKQIIQGSRFFATGPRGGKTLKDAPVDPFRLTSRHGGSGIVGSISVNTRALPTAIEVGSDKVYAPIHELGLGRYPKRAFLAPAVDATEHRFPEMFLKNWKRLSGE